MNSVKSIFLTDLTLNRFEWDGQRQELLCLMRRLEVMVLGFARLFTEWRERGGGGIVSLRDGFFPLSPSAVWDCHFIVEKSQIQSVSI